MGQGDQVEEMDHPEMIEALKELEREKLENMDNMKILKNSDIDLTHVRPTEMKYNTRVRPPMEATRKSEAAILLQGEAVKKAMNQYIRKQHKSSVLSDEEARGK